MSVVDVMHFLAEGRGRKVSRPFLRFRNQRDTLFTRVANSHFRINISAESHLGINNSEEPCYRFDISGPESRFGILISVAGFTASLTNSSAIHIPEMFFL